MRHHLVDLFDSERSRDDPDAAGFVESDKDYEAITGPFTSADPEGSNGHRHLRCGRRSSRKRRAGERGRHVPLRGRRREDRPHHRPTGAPRRRAASAAAWCPWHHAAPPHPMRAGRRRSTSSSTTARHGREQLLGGVGRRARGARATSPGSAVAHERRHRLDDPELQLGAGRAARTRTTSSPRTRRARRGCVDDGLDMHHGTHRRARPTGSRTASRTATLRSSASTSTRRATSTARATRARRRATTPPRCAWPSSPSSPRPTARFSSVPKFDEIGAAKWRTATPSDNAIYFTATTAYGGKEKSEVLKASRTASTTRAPSQNRLSATDGAIRRVRRIPGVPWLGRLRPVGRRRPTPSTLTGRGIRRLR